eukprot:TRINITY_DN4626_c0_g1_i1.p1 TRINITY_DN4626_c0_g1~~TRINITY_DN4626_c0_g1_i1.p1  ORF type:complete len:167 (-),score=54.94 TRINITY_DN4626_c0_g1_i1:54-554(-)
MCFFFFQAEDGIRDLVRSRGLGDVYKRQAMDLSHTSLGGAAGVMILSALAASHDSFRRLILDHNPLGPDVMPILVRNFLLRLPCYVSTVGCDFTVHTPGRAPARLAHHSWKGPLHSAKYALCLLYTSDAADDLLCVDLGGRRIIKKKKFITHCYLVILKHTSYMSP